MKKAVKEKSNDKTLTVVCIILIFIIIGLVGFIGYTLGQNTTRQVNSNYVNKNNTTEEEIKDIDDLTELSTEIDAILSNQKSTEYIASNNYSNYRFRYGVLKNAMTKEYKQEIVLNNIEWDEITDDSWQKYDKMKEIVDSYTDPELEDNWYLEESKQVTADKVNKYSISLFGEKITNPKEEISSCPLYLYDKNQQLYFKPSPQCGGTYAGEVNSYKSKFTQKGTIAYIYVSIAYIIPNEDGTFTIYKDIDYPSYNLYYGQTTYIDKYETEYPIYSESQFTLNETNYKEFSEYKFTFEQATNGNYYFVKVEQTKKLPKVTFFN